MTRDRMTRDRMTRDRMTRERMKRERVKRERGGSQVGEEKIKNATSAGMLRWCQYLSHRKRSSHYLSVKKGRATI